MMRHGLRGPTGRRRATPRTAVGALAAMQAAMLVGCAVGPDYRRPDVATPDHFKESAPAAAASAASAASGAGEHANVWQPAQPADTQARAPWWHALGDQQLNDLLEQVGRANASLAAAVATYRQAQALDQQARAALFPTVGVNGSVTREGGGGGSSGTGTVPPRTVRSVSLNADWEVDVWGRVRRDLEAQHAQAEASAADLASTRLSLQAEAAVDYVGLRIADAQIALLQDTAVAYDKSLTITRNRYQAGVVTSADVAQAQTQLLTVRTQLTDARLQRAQLEHALAVLAGQPPASFSIVPKGLPTMPTAAMPGPQAAASADAAPRVSDGRSNVSNVSNGSTVVALSAIRDTDRLGLQLPAVPATLPATLLQRRPDIAAAERRAAAANAQIGVAQAAYFPTLTLSASGGYSGLTGTDLFSLPHRVWSIGPALAETLFDGGARQSAKASAVAAFDQAAAQYRQTVLSALSDVEDQLVAQRDLAQEYDTQTQAVAAALESLRITQNQYLAGTVDYLSVATAQSTALSAQRSALDIQQRQYTAAIDLIKALGGGWPGLSEEVAAAEK